ncbi:unnamed protein product [Heterobilharzia americana]|nr:unnamed protein product [Heterobilharzia americana]
MDTEGLLSAKLFDSASKNILLTETSTAFDSFLRNIKDLEQELNDTFSEFDSKMDVQPEFAICLTKNSVTSLYHAELLKALKKVGLGYDDYVKTMADLELGKEPEQPDKSDLEVTGENFRDLAEEMLSGSFSGVDQNSSEEKVTNVSDNNEELVNTQSKIQSMHQRIEDEIMKYEKSNEDDLDPSIMEEMLNTFQSEEEYIRQRIQELEKERKCEEERLERIQQIKEESLVLNGNSRLRRGGSSLDIMQTNFISSYFSNECMIRPQSAEHTINYRQSSHYMNLVEKNFEYYFTVSKEKKVENMSKSCLHKEMKTFNIHEKTIGKQGQTNEIIRTVTLPVIGSSASVTEPAISKGQQYDELKASHLGTSNDIQCELASRPLSLASDEVEKSKQPPFGKVGGGVARYKV